MPYVPTGAWWQRAWEVFRTAVENVSQRWREFWEREHYDRIEHWKRPDSG